MSDFLGRIRSSFPLALRNASPQSYPFVCYYASQILAVFLSNAPKLGVTQVKCVIGTVGDDPDMFLHCWIDCCFEEQHYVVDPTFSQYNGKDEIWVERRSTTRHHAKYVVPIEHQFPKHDNWDTFLSLVLEQHPFHSYAVRHWQLSPIKFEQNYGFEIFSVSRSIMG